VTFYLEGDKMAEPKVIHVKRRCPERKPPGDNGESSSLFKPDDCIIQLDTQIYLHDIECAERISERYPGKLWIAPDILIELNNFKEMPPKKREKIGIEIDDFGGHIARIHKITSCLGGDPFRFPTFSELSSRGERGTEAAEKIQAAADCAYGGKSCNGNPSCADKGLFTGPVYGNGDEFDGKKYSWPIFSRDKKVQGVGKNLRMVGYHVVTVSEVEALDYHASKFL
jgi:hypothetical protein